MTPLASRRATSLSRWFESFRRPWRENASRHSKGIVIAGAIITGSFVLMAIFAPQLATHDPVVYTEDARAAPSGEHYFGTTRLGYDVWSQCVFGARIALQVVLASTLLSLVIALPLGLLSGYRGGKLDQTLVLVMDSIYAFPSLLLAIIFQSLFRPDIIAASMRGWADGSLLREALVWAPVGAMQGLHQTPILSVAVAISVVYVPQYFRVIRNHVVAVKSEPYVEAARAIGAKPRTIVSKYVLFNVVQNVPVILTLNAADAILTLAGLGFLGYGLPPPTPEWGYNLSRAAGEITFSPPIWWTSVFPGLFIVLLVLGITLLGEGLNDVYNPLLREGKK